MQPTPRGYSISYALPTATRSTYAPLENISSGSSDTQPRRIDSLAPSSRLQDMRPTPSTTERSFYTQQYTTSPTSSSSSRSSATPSSAAATPSTAPADPWSQRLGSVSVPRHQARLQVAQSTPSIETPAADSKPLQCFDHGCDGRVFSCMENLRRHIREQSGNGRVQCPFCDLTFSRKSNLKTHYSKDRCRVVNQC